MQFFNMFLEGNLTSLRVKPAKLVLTCVKCHEVLESQSLGLEAPAHVRSTKILCYPCSIVPSNLVIADVDHILFIQHYFYVG